VEHDEPILLVASLAKQNSSTTREKSRGCFVYEPAPRVAGVTVALTAAALFACDIPPGTPFASVRWSRYDTQVHRRGAASADVLPARMLG